MKPKLVGVFLLIGLITGGAIAGWGHSNPPPNPGPRRRPDIILIVIDTLAAKHMSLYGYERETTPFLKKWAAEDAFVFTNAFASASYTFPSHVSIFSGQSVLKHKREMKFQDDTARMIPTSLKLIPEFLKAAGYKTAWFATTEDSQLPLDRGFSRGYDDFFHVSGEDPFVNDDRVAWLNENKNVPKFIFMHSYMVHDPYVPLLESYGTFNIGRRRPMIDTAPEWSRLLDELTQNGVAPGDFENFYWRQFDIHDPKDMEIARTLYDEEIVQLDLNTSRFIQLLKDLDIYDEAVVIFTSDHGEAFMEHGRIKHNTSNYEVLHIPLLIHAPHLQRGVSKALVQHTDLLPTILDFAGVEIPPQAEGFDLRPVFKRPDLEFRKELYSEPGPTGPYSVQDREWKLIFYGGDSELYNIENDPFETHRVEEKYPEIVKKYELKIRQRLYRNL